MTTLWGGRFKEGLDQDAWRLNTSIQFDRRLAHQDIRGSLAWATALEKAGLINQDECIQISNGLSRIEDEFIQGSFNFQESDEDIHTAVERRLGELIGPLAGKLHTGRSRNDQVATDFRLWMLDNLSELDKVISNLQSVLVDRAESDLALIMPGYTHLQPAQPILLSHWWLSHFWPLGRDRQRLADLLGRTASLPLGSAALAGSTIAVDRSALAEALGFTSPTPNSIDAVSDRDFAVEFLFFAALCGVHLSRLAEAVILFTSAEFGFFELSDAFSTGSSLMPQKKNADIFELTRGKSGALTGHLTGLLMTIKGLPSAYDKDLQEDKQPVFAAYDILMAIIPVLAKALATLSVDEKRMRAAISPAMMATNLADALVETGIPFRQAHNLVGQAVRMAAQADKPLDQLSPVELQTISPNFIVDIRHIFDPVKGIERHNVTGGTAPPAVLAQIEQAHRALKQLSNLSQV